MSEEPEKPIQVGGMAQVCVRCGSKDHSTRDHDEGNYPGGKAAGKAASKPKPKPKPVQASGKQGLIHTKCWTDLRCDFSNRRDSGPTCIPEILDKPDKRVPYSDPAAYAWSCREGCTCLNCAKKKRERNMYVEERKKKSLNWVDGKYEQNAKLTASAKWPKEADKK